MVLVLSPWNCLDKLNELTYEVSNLNKSWFFLWVWLVYPSVAVLGDLWIRGEIRTAAGAPLEKLEPAERATQLDANP